MYKKSSVLLILSFISGMLLAQDYGAYKYMYQIDSTNLRNVINILASDAFEGRGTAQPGGAKTQQYIAQQLKANAIASAQKNANYFQYIDPNVIANALEEREIMDNGAIDLGIKSANVLAIIEGSHYKDEYIILGAHHDHDGIKDGKIYSGADDNASGVAAVLEIGRVLNKAKQEGKGPKRTIILLFFDAEEIGLIGSKYYVDNPIYPLETTRACVNFDMLGRRSSYYNALNESNYLMLTQDEKLSGDLPLRTTQLNRNVLNIDTRDKHFEGTDHYNFAQAGVPALSFFSGLHKDYHTPADVAQLIDMQGMLARVRLGLLLAWDLANATYIQPIN